MGTTTSPNFLLFFGSDSGCGNPVFLLYFLDLYPTFPYFSLEICLEILFQRGIINFVLFEICVGRLFILDLVWKLSLIHI